MSVRKTRLEIYRGLGGFGTLGLEIVLSVLFGLFVGNWADGRWGTDPWLTLLGMAFGMAAGVRAVQRALKLMKREALREEREQGNPVPLFETDRDRDARTLETERALEISRSARDGENESDRGGSPGGDAK